MLDFPASPSVGQKYPASPLAGIPTYTWDGEKWTTQGGSIVSASPGTALPLMNAKPALVGVSTNFSREDHVHPVDTSRAPFDAMAYGGLQINGGFEVSQERGTSGTSTNATYICDGWYFSVAGTMVVTGAQITTFGFAGFRAYLGVSVSTAAVSLGAGDIVSIQQTIEGSRIARLAWGIAGVAQPITLGFWTSHHRTGLYSGAVRNAANNRSYVFTYTQVAADTPQYNTVTIPGCTDGVWATDNTGGLVVSFAVASGTNYIAPSANIWLTGAYFAAPGQANAVGATSDAFRITGVTVLPGSEAPSAARSPFVMRSFADELMICRRYYQKTYDYLSLPGAITVGGALTWRNQMTESFGFAGLFYLTPEMRTVPTIAMFSPNSGNPGKIWNNVAGDVAGAVGGSPSTKFAYFNVAGVSIGTPPTYNIVHAVADARL